MSHSAMRSCISKGEEIVRKLQGFRTVASMLANELVGELTKDVVLDAWGEFTSIFA